MAAYIRQIGRIGSLASGLKPAHGSGRVRRRAASYPSVGLPWRRSTRTAGIGPRSRICGSAGGTWSTGRSGRRDRCALRCPARWWAVQGRSSGFLAVPAATNSRFERRIERQRRGPRQAGCLGRRPQVCGDALQRRRDTASGTDRHPVVPAQVHPARPCPREAHDPGGGRRVTTHHAGAGWHLLDTGQRLPERGRAVAVFTGASSRAGETLLKAAGLDVDVLIGGDHVQRPKPAGDGLFLAAKRFGVAPDDLAYIGDSPLDLRAAAAAGSRSAAAMWGHLYDGAEPCDATLTRPEEALELLAGDHNDERPAAGAV
ncbi:HAD family hydrolase [Streptomyces sp. NPDC054808]